MLKNKLIFMVVCSMLLIVTDEAFGISSKAGKAGANFLKIGVSARVSAIGEAFCAVADDISSIYYNPAGLTQINSKTYAVMHTDWLESVNYEFLAYAERYNDKAFGISLCYLGMSKMTAKDINNQPLGEFSAHDLALSLAYAKKLTERLSTAANLKFIQQKLEQEISSSAAIDIGVLYKNKNLSFGACISNLGTKIKFIKEKDKLPLNLRFGIAYKLLDNRILISSDINCPIDNDVNFGIGTEYQITNNLLFRAGYNSKSDLGSGISLGCGFKVRNFQVDYSFLPYERLGNVHRVSLQFRVKEPPKKNKIKLSPPVVELEPAFTIEQEKPKEIIAPIKKPGQWIKGNRYKVKKEAVSGKKHVWLRIGSPYSQKRYSLKEGVEVEYLGEKIKGFYKIIVITEGKYKGRQGWVFGGSFEEIKD